MKKLKIYLSVLFVCFITIQLYCQDSSVNANLTQEVYARIEPTATNITLWILMSWSFFLILISIPFYFNHKKIRERQLIISSLIEKGKEIPKELMVHSTVPGRSDFHKGVILTAMGIAVVIVLLSLKIANNYWTVGLIPLLIGVAYLISFKFDKRDKMKSELD
jgi:hypothetical protein